MSSTRRRFMHPGGRAVFSDVAWYEIRTLDGRRSLAYPLAGRPSLGVDHGRGSAPTPTVITATSTRGVQRTATTSQSMGRGTQSWSRIMATPRSTMKPYAQSAGFDGANEAALKEIAPLKLQAGFHRPEIPGSGRDARAPGRCLARAL